LNRAAMKRGGFFKNAFPVQLGKKTGTTRPHLPQGAE
jgi:hypothetical protein